jgi:hypothetical protein
MSFNLIFSSISIYYLLSHYTCLKGVSLMGDKNMKPKSGCGNKAPKAEKSSTEKNQAKNKPKKK